MYVRQYATDARAREKPCLRCGLSLRKHLDDRYCPQCGLSVWMSLNPNDALDYSNARWLRRASRGAWVMAAVQLIALAAYLVGFGASAASTVAMITHPPRPPLRHTATRPAAAPVEAPQPAAAPPPAATPGASGDPDDSDDSDDAVDAVDAEDHAVFAPTATPPLASTIAAGLAGVYFVCEAVGLVMMAVHEERYPDRTKGIRAGARAAAAVAAVLGVGLLLLAGRSLVTRHAPGGLFGWLVLLAVEIVFAGCAFVSWFWLRPIARRAGKSSLARLCGYLLFLPVLPFLKAAPFLGLWMFYLVSPLLQFVPLVYLPLSVYLFARCALLLHAAVPHAEAAWAAETKAGVAT